MSTSPPLEPLATVGPQERSRIARSEFANSGSLALENFARDREAADAIHGPTVRMTHADKNVSAVTSIIGGTQRTLILALPTLGNGEPVAVEAGERWVFRTIHQTSALRFEGVVRAVVAGDAPHVSVGLIGEIERRVVRKATRVPVSLRASLLAAEIIHSIVLDLSVGGVRLAMAREAKIHVGETVTFSTSLMIADRLYALELKSIVVGRDPAPADHPGVAIYRIRFDSLAENSFLVLQAYLATELVDELDYFWRLVAGPLRQ
jgi:hypothetical protein